jgi:hypothetical protein
MPTARSIEAMLIKRLFKQTIIQNNVRGDWAEEMVAQALGGPWKVVSGGWHPWDIQRGSSKARAPRRIRIQVRNSAALQTWEQPKIAQASFTISKRPRPSYFKRDNRGAHCERFGHLCEVYVFAWHGEKDRTACNHRDPAQWKFYVVAAKDLPNQKRISRARLEERYCGDPVEVHDLRQRVKQICRELRANRTITSESTQKVLRRQQPPRTQLSASL